MEYNVDMNLLKQFFDRCDLLALVTTLYLSHFLDQNIAYSGEGELRASRNCQTSIKSGENMGDQFDWLISYYSAFPDNVWRIEFGVTENSGLNQVDSMEKACTDIVKVIKTVQDQLLEIIRKVWTMYGTDHLP
ncbi:hypothetical protein BC938DRAFT_473759 [Jimgerdemannia flammicorona]|uniref:Uncharacterized protein n=1 Tax=Jimgerdemannia flammicorona TaxID=994334 RepID=A0A433QT61_9FUNG|nr:hypothetical protein BC938DRAFT_473759 [Jimgerdemannia flammicorona]